MSISCIYNSVTNNAAGGGDVNGPALLNSVERMMRSAGASQSRPQLIYKVKDYDPERTGRPERRGEVGSESQNI